MAQEKPHEAHLPRERLFSRSGRLTGALGFGRPRLVMTFKRLLREGASLEDALAAE